VRAVDVGRTSYQNASMPNVLVRDLPDEVHASLQQHAASAGQSLQQYLLAELTKLAGRPTLNEVLAAAGRLSGGRVGFATAVEDLRAERPAS
jgi:plasmid stability protein